MRTRLFLGVLTLLSVGVSEVMGSTWQVDAAGTPGVDCDCVTIQACMDSASAGDTVLVACGTYYEHDIDMKSGVALLSETGQPDCVTVDAELQGRVIHFEDADATTRVEGFTLTGGSVSGSWPTNSGGAVLCRNSSPYISLCALMNNSAHAGGGLCCVEESAPVLSNLTFSGNSAAWGGGLCADHSSASMSSSAFLGNTASDSYGGAVYAWFATLALTEVSFSENSARYGGAIYSDVSSSIDITRSAFSRNSAADLGGAVACQYTISRLTDCAFYQNSAGAVGGAAYYFDCSNPAIAGCTLVGNSANTGSSIYCLNFSVSLENSIIAFGQGGVAVSCDGYGGTVAECCDVYGNEGGDWVGCLEGQLGVDGNFSECPLFCDPASDDYSLQECSPCAPENHPTGYDCGLIGAFHVGCECGLPSIVERGSWGAMKAMYR